MHLTLPGGPSSITLKLEPVEYVDASEVYKLIQ